MVTGDVVNGSEADAACAAAGGVPAIIESKEEMELLKGMYHILSKNVLISSYVVWFKNTLNINRKRGAAETYKPFQSKE